MESRWEAERARMVERIRSTTGIDDERILNAFRRIPRDRFVPASQQELAYEDRALPLSDDQTISQPSMVAIMLAALDCRPSDRVLEVGAGSGYAAALLGCLCARVDAIEIRPALAESARQTLSDLGFDNVYVHLGDGSAGLPERAPFDRILVSAGADAVPEALLAQLAPGGRMAIPVGGEIGQTLMIGDKHEQTGMRWSSDVACMFVPLVRGA